MDDTPGIEHGEFTVRRFAEVTAALSDGRGPDAVALATTNRDRQGGRTSHVYPLSAMVNPQFRRFQIEVTTDANASAISGALGSDRWHGETNGPFGVTKCLDARAIRR